MATGFRLVLLISALAILSPASFAFAAEDDEPWLELPGRPRIPLPPGMHVYGPKGGAGEASPAVPKPDADLYHEYGTVTPGGGRRGASGPKGAEQPSVDRGYGGQNFGGQNFGGMVVGPGGLVPPTPQKRAAAPKKKPPTLEEKQAQIRKALMPKPPVAAARRQTLDELYAKLAAAQDEDEAKGLASLIAAIWMRSGSDTANLLMARAEKAVADKKYALAVKVLDQVVELDPNWAEAWNKRASARYLADDLDGAMADVDHVLKLEPNNFSALGGMAMILQRTGFPKRALQVFRRDLAIYPHQAEVEKIIEKLTLEVEGQGI